MSKPSRILVLSAILVVAPAINSFARGRHSSESDETVLFKFLILGVVLLVWLAYAVIHAVRKPKPLSQEKLAELQAEAIELGKQFEAGEFIPPDTFPLVLGTDEIALLHEPSKLIEARALEQVWKESISAAANQRRFKV